jgi:hypothetical protein
MKPNDIVHESLTQEGMWDNLKGKFSKQPQAEPVKQEPTAKGYIPQQHFIGQNADNRIDPQGSGNAPVAQDAKIDPSMGYQAPVATPTTTYNAPTGSLPPVSTTMPQNMQTSASKTTTPVKPTYNAPSAVPTTNNMMPSGMQTTASSSTPAPSTSRQQRTAPTPADMARVNATTPPTENPVSTSRQQRTAPTPADMARVNATATAPATATTSAPAAVEPTPTEKKGGILKGIKNAATNVGGGVLQGVKDLFDPNAKIARGANKVANKVRADNVKSEVQKWQMITRGMDPADTEGYQAAFANWAKQQYADVDPAAIDEIAATLDPKRPATITQAISSALNTQMAARPTMSKQDIQGKEREEHLAKLHKDAEDEALYQSYKDQLARKHNPGIDTSKLAKALIKTGNVTPMKPVDTAQEPAIPAQPPMTAPDEAGQIEQIKSYIKTIDDRKAQLQQYLDALEKKSQPDQTTIAPKQPAALTDKYGRNTPSTNASFEQRAKAEWEAQHPGVPYPVSEGKNFGGILWKKMRDSK